MSWRCAAEMPRYQIVAQGRQWNCDAADAEWARRLFEVNVGELDEAALATLTDIDDYKPAPKPKRRRR
jgi:hypothetical protein